MQKHQGSFPNQVFMSGTTRTITTGWWWWWRFIVLPRMLHLRWIPVTGQCRCCCCHCHCRCRRKGDTHQVFVSPVMAHWIVVDIQQPFRAGRFPYCLEPASVSLAPRDQMGVKSETDEEHITATNVSTVLISTSLLNIRIVVASISPSCLSHVQMRSMSQYNSRKCASKNTKGTPCKVSSRGSSLRDHLKKKGNCFRE